MMNDPNAIIEAQKEQISRYQSRLKDVISAYKSLLKEKEALDISIKALTSQKNGSSTSSEDTKDDESKQIMLSSLATLSAEKSRMEASFQNEKKNMRLEQKAKDQKITMLSEKVKMLELEKETCKSTFERILSDERHLKESLETQLLQLKTQFITAPTESELNQEICDLRRKLKAYESNTSIQDSSILHAIQSETENLKQHYFQKANEANERSRKLTADHEKQVQSLEAKLSDLSSSISKLSKLREVDQGIIMHLKETISDFSKNSNPVPSKTLTNNKSHPEDEPLIEINQRSQGLTVMSSSSGSISSDKYFAKKQLCEKLKKENELMRDSIARQSLSIATLQEKVSVLNKNIEDYENEIHKSSQLNEAMKTERFKHREAIKSLELEHRSKISSLELQLQKQRERSLILLEEKENEIRSLKFMKKEDNFTNVSRKASSSRSDEEGHPGEVLTTAGSSNNVPETHMIYYSNELARKENELTGLRKAKREAEAIMRQTLKDKISIQETMDEKIAALEQQVDRLERTKSREGESLEYLKNLVLKYLTPTNQQSSQKMYLKAAIAAVLKFDENESKLVGLSERQEKNK